MDRDQNKERRNIAVRCFKKYYNKRREMLRECENIREGRAKPQNYGKGYDTSDPVHSIAVEVQKVEDRYSDEDWKWFNCIQEFMIIITNYQASILVAQHIMGQSPERVRMDQCISRSQYYADMQEITGMFYAYAKKSKLLK